MSNLSVIVRGQRSHLQPLAYPALASLFATGISLVTAKQDADLVLFGHPRDLIAAKVEMFDLIRFRPQIRIVLLSEEPYWDTVGAITPFQRQQSLHTESGLLPFTFLNHHTSAIFDFAKIPYFLLTQHHFSTRYAQRFRRNQCKTPDDWAAHFKDSAVWAAFVVERRISERVDVAFADHDVKGLSLWRTKLAEACETGNVLRLGKGWPVGSQDRRQLIDWHLDKLLFLDGACRFVSAIENTHQQNYLSEKLFDAFAVGAVPLYFASPLHSVHRMVPANSWLNLYGMTVQEAVSAINGMVLDTVFLEQYCLAQNILAKTFNDTALLVAERERVRRAIVDEFCKILASGH